ncbi:hypothetical protein Cal7507_3540 [Calothrix sp. PCC 7507]|nr:hypothetical protein Cal7507_3540 [Calothrix sp. PCC 7507]
MHAVKIISCALLSVLFPSLSYASDGMPVVSSPENTTEESLQPQFGALPNSPQELPVVSSPEMNTEEPLELQPEVLPLASSVSTQAKDLQTEIPLSPLQEPPTKLHNLETANQLRKGAVQVEAGFLQVLPLDDSVSGTGLQTYNIDIDWGVTDDLQLGFTGDIYDDYVKCPVREQCGDFTSTTYGAKLKYRLINQNLWAVGVVGTAQLMNISASPGAFTNTSNTRLNTVTPVGALQFPITYKASPNLQLHFTPGVVLFPETVKGADFFGSFFNIGTGFSWQPSERVNLFANIQAPLGPGGNTFSSKDRSIYRKLLWAVGVDYAFNPRMAAEVYATNSFGTTPTTGLLAFIPDGDDLLLGIRFKHVIDFGQGYAANFGNRPQTELSRRDSTLLFDGFTLASPHTLPTGKFQARGGLGTNGSSSFALAYGLTNDAQLEINVDQFGGSDRLSGAEISGPGVKIGGAVKLRFLDQARGDLLSLSFKLAGISEAAFQGNALNGTIYAELPIAYQLSPQTSISINPKGAFFGKVSRTGIGIGINQALGNQLQFIAEYTPIFTDGTRDVWSTGLRFLPSSRWGIDIFAGNAIGQSGLGTVTAESGTNVGFSINWGI